VHEGGISTPLIVHWPKGVARNRGNKLDATPGHLIDIMATCVDVAGLTNAFEGISLRPAFRGNRLARPQPIFWEHEGNRAIRDGKWKLVAKENKPWELYDMEVDRTETHNLASAQPEKVRELNAQWDTWAKRANVLPLGTWREKGQAGE
jgi:arylsulfatase